MKSMPDIVLTVILCVVPLLIVLSIRLCRVKKPGEGRHFESIDDERKVRRMESLFGDQGVNRASNWKVCTADELAHICSEAFEVLSKMYGDSKDDLALATADRCEKLAVWAVKNARDPRCDLNDLLHLKDKPKCVADLLRAMVSKA